jgi:hypothetical protein
MTAVNGERAGRYDVLSLAEGFHVHDMAALARLTAAERAAQLDIRERLWWHTDQMWDHAKAEARKAQVRNPAQDPRYSAVAAMRDLLAELRAHAADAIVAAGDNRS